MFRRREYVIKYLSLWPFWPGSRGVCAGFVDALGRDAIDECIYLVDGVCTVWIVEILVTGSVEVGLEISIDNSVEGEVVWAGV